MLQLRPLCVTCFLALVNFFSATLALGGEDTPAMKEAPRNRPRAKSVYLVPERVRLDDDQFVAYERGLIFVPLLRNRADSTLVSVEFCRFKNERENRGLPPLFKLHGGPGFPGLSAPDLRYLENNVWPVTRELGTDYVVVGQRGIGSSKPNTLLGPIGGFPADQPVTAEDFKAAIQQACIAGKTYWESEGFDLEGFNIVEAAADVDDIRNALEYEQMIISGTSFGSHWGMAVMRYHPKAVARAVLSGMEGPNHTWDVPRQVLNAMERIATEAEQNAVIAKHLSGSGLIDVLSAVLERLEQTPVMVPIHEDDTKQIHNVLLDARAIRGRVLSGMSSRYGIRKWPARLLSWNRGNFEQAASEHLGDVAPLNGVTASFFLMDCGSGVSRSRRSAIDTDPSSKIIGRVNEAYRAAESVWNVDQGAEFRANFDTDIPTLIVQGTWDINTPIENAKELAPHFKNGKLVTVERGSHAALREAMELSPPFKGQLMQFLRTGDHSVIPAKVVLPGVEWTTPLKENG